MESEGSEGAGPDLRERGSPGLCGSAAAGLERDGSARWVWQGLTESDPPLPRGHSRPLKQLSPGTLDMDASSGHCSCFLLRGVLGASMALLLALPTPHTLQGFLMNIRPCRFSCSAHHPAGSHKCPVSQRLVALPEEHPPGLPKAPPSSSH